MEKFVIIDESLMPDGFWVYVDGIDLTQFEKNPIMYFQHIRPGDYQNSGKDMVHAIGTWTDWKKETINGFKAITAVPVFDEKDTFAMTIKQKVESGVYKMASAGLAPMAWTEEKEYLKEGQTRFTLLKSKLKEASIVDRGRNENAIKLYSQDAKEINLSDFNLTTEIQNLTNMETLNLSEVRTILVLGENTTRAEALKALETMAKEHANFKAEIVTLKEAKTTLEAKLLEFAETRKNNFLAKLDSKELKLSEANKAIYKEMFEKDVELAEKALSLAPSYKPLATIPASGEVSDKYKDLSFTEMSQKHSSVLASWKAENQELFNEKYKAEFGKDYKF